MSLPGSTPVARRARLATLMLDGRGLPAQILRLSPAAITVRADVPVPVGRTLGVFLPGVGRLETRVVVVAPTRLELEFLTDTRNRWRRLQALRAALAGPRADARDYD